MTKTSRVPAGCPTHSPWGEVQTGKKLCPGVWKVTTASHGGILVSDEFAHMIPRQFRTDWYEEDDAVDIVYWFIPESAEHNPRIDREACRRRLMKSWAREWEEAGLGNADRR